MEQLKLIYFTAPSCSVCESLLPKLKCLMGEKYQDIELQVIDVMRCPELAADLGVFTVPVVILTIEDKENERWIRSFGLIEIEGKLDRLISIMTA